MAKNNKQTAGQDSGSKMVALGSKKFIAQHLNYARTSAVVRLQKVSLPATYPIYPKDLCNIFQVPLPYIPTFSPISLRFLKRFCRFTIVDSSVIYDF